MNSSLQGTALSLVIVHFYWHGVSC